MATGTIIYNKEQKQIFPISDATVITSEATKVKSTVEENLKQLFAKISELSGDDEASSNIVVIVEYCLATTKIKSEVEKLSSWTDTFEVPSPEYPYAWKRTTYTHKGSTLDGTVTYEIIAVDAKETQTIYTAKSTSIAPTITYPILKDGYGDPILDENGNTQEDLTAFDKKLPDGWLETPISIGPATPYAFMATRKRVEGLWGRYSEPAQYGRWAFDSQLELRYAITTDGSTPRLNNTSDDPGSAWSLSTPDDFTGKLWMITATSVNGVLNSDENNVRWYGPHLMSIIK